jgi:hypothetical protein
MLYDPYFQAVMNEAHGERLRRTARPRPRRARRSKDERPRVTIRLPDSASDPVHHSA